MTADFIAYLIAIAIPLLAISIISALDLFETGKITTIVMCMIWGGTFAFGAAYLLNTVMIQSLGVEIVATLTAPVIEEVLKALVLVYFIQSPRFRYIVDGAVYGFAVGIGFAVVENLAYLAAAEAALPLAITRVLSTSLMHAAASGSVGILLGRLRRASLRGQIILPVIGLALAAFVHIFYNTLVNQLSGLALLLVAICIGMGGSAIIGYIIRQSISEEKASFTATLKQPLNVAPGERMALQRLGGTAIEKELAHLESLFGTDNIAAIRRLLVMQANIGILHNNLQSARVSPRLRRAWEAELAQLQAEVTRTRRQLGRYVSLYLQNLFPAGDTAIWSLINAEMAAYDPTLINQFDMFMRVSQMAQSFTPNQLEETAIKLRRISIFKYIDLADLENLSRAVELTRYEQGAMLFDQGEQGNAMYLIESGTIHIFTLDAQRQETHFRTFQPGDVVGDFAVLDGKPRSARARAGSALYVIRLSRETFMMFIQSRPQVIMAMLQALAEKARYTTEAVQEGIQWASDLAQGDYSRAAALRAAASAVESENSELPLRRPESVAGVFAQAALSLQARDPSAQPKAD